MPIHEYECRCGRFESFRGDKCPICGQVGRLLISAPARIISKSSESLPLGNKSRGRFIPPTKGRSGILIPSFGVLEKEEIDYIAEGMIEKENNRVRKSETKDKIEKLTNLAMNTKQGKRAEVLKEAIGG